MLYLCCLRVLARLRLLVAQLFETIRQAISRFLNAISSSWGRDAVQLELQLMRSYSNSSLQSPTEIGFTHHRASHSQIRRRLQASALNPLGPMDSPLATEEPVPVPKLMSRLARLNPFEMNPLELNPFGMNPFAKAAMTRSDITFLREGLGPRPVARQSLRRRKVLVLDLDETLVHASVSGGADCDLITEVFLQGRSCLYYVKKRPHVDTFLETVARWYQLAIFTASVREYADAVISWLDGGRALFAHRLFRSVNAPVSHCLGLP